MCRFDNRWPGKAARTYQQHERISSANASRGDVATWDLGWRTFRRLVHAATRLDGLTSEPADAERRPDPSAGQPGRERSAGPVI